MSYDFIFSQYNMGPKRAANEVPVNVETSICGFWFTKKRQSQQKKTQNAGVSLQIRHSAGFTQCTFECL